MFEKFWKEILQERSQVLDSKIMLKLILKKHELGHLARVCENVALFRTQ
jgi:hypothetical protein